MEVGDRITIEITGISHQGYGVGREAEQVVFVPGAMLGETVIGEITENKKKFANARLVAVEKPSAHRLAEPLCPVHDQCGGCELQHCDYEYQLAAKRQIVEEQLQRIGGQNVPVNPVLGMENPWRYRNKGLFHADYSTGRVRLGFYGAGSHEFLPAEHCMLFSERVNRLTEELEELIQNTGKAYEIQKILIRESYLNREIMIVFVTQNNAWKMGNLAQKVLELPNVVSVYHNINTNPKLMLGRKFHLLAGKETITDVIGEIRYEISPQSFFQVNNEQADVLYRTALNFAGLTGREEVADVYCGIGTISLYLARNAAHVLGIESVPQAIVDARKNAKDNDISNCTFVAEKAENYLPKWVTQGNRLDVAVIDPPRSGCEEDALEALVLSGAEKIVYVSCNPSTLARDLKYLSGRGYQVTEVQPVDLFCQSWHVESVVLLSKKNEKNFIEIGVDTEDYYRIKEGNLK